MTIPHYQSLTCLFIGMALLMSCEQSIPVTDGISLALAQDRKSNLSDLSYDLYFDIPATASDSIHAKATLRFDMKDARNLQIDFHAPSELLKHITVNNQVVPVSHAHQHILIDKKWLNDGHNEVNITFIAGDMSLNRNPDYLYTLFVPERASTCFPAFDQPDLKARYHLQLRVPLDWEAVANGSDKVIDTLGGKKRIDFQETQPISTYHFAFAAGKFKKTVDPGSGMTMYYRDNDSVKVAANVGAIFELHQKALSWLTEYTGITYPFEKFDFALIPTFQYGGMEHPGSIFYRESSILLDPSASVNQELRRASLISHETAHMWFGDLVTMSWFNDVWLKEVFANFMAAKIVNPSFPEINHNLRFLLAHYPAAYEVDRSQGSHPIQQPLENLKDAGSLYGAIIYQKAPIMMRNLEALVGEENFRQGLQDYLSAHAYGNATWDDLINSLKKFSDKDLDVWNKAWIKTKGMPEVTCAKSPHRLGFSVTNDKAGTLWPQSFDYKMIQPDSQTFHIVIQDAHPVVIDVDSAEDGILLPNFGGTGYGYFPADEKSRDFMLRNVNAFDNPEVRAGIWMDLWEYTLAGDLDPEALFQHLLLGLDEEKNPLLLEYLVDKMQTVFWQFLSPAQRQQITTSMEDHLFELIALEQDPSLKRTLFNGYYHVAISKEGVANMIRFWSDEVNLGLELSERDHIQLAYEIAVRGTDDAERILNTQLARIKNPDRQSEMAFVIPALSADVATRELFFNQLKDADNRAHEPWVLEGLRYLHHPLRASTSVAYITPSLELLEEIQRTGDIFFPKGWLDATLGTYRSKQAADDVRHYLDTHSDLPDFLRNKVLQSSDMLFRAEEAEQAR